MTDWILDRLAALERRVTELEQASGKGAPRERAQRLPLDWTPAPDVLAWAEEKFPDVNERAEREKFGDYWRSRGETRLDWQAGYRNWIRKAAELSPRRGSAPHSGPPSRAAGISAGNRAKRDRALDQLAKVRGD